MKRRVLWVGFAVVIASVSGCTHSGHTHRSDAGTTTIAVAGPEGAAFHGWYVRDGQRVPVRGVVPFSFADVGLSEFEIRKEHPDYPLAVMAQHDRRGWHYESFNEAVPGVPGVRVVIRKGLAVETLGP
jgi:hypothetical protein